MKDWLEKLKDKWIRRTEKINGCKVIINDGKKRGLCRLGLHSLHRSIHWYSGSCRTYCTYECHYCDYEELKL